MGPYDHAGVYQGDAENAAIGVAVMLATSAIILTFLKKAGFRFSIAVNPK